MKIEAFVLVGPGFDPIATSKPWILTKSDKGSVWYRLTAEVPDPFQAKDVPTEVTAVAPKI